MPPPPSIPSQSPDTSSAARSDKRLAFTRFSLVGAAWITAAIAMPLQCCDLNGFLAWRGPVSTSFFVRWIFTLPRALAQDWLQPATPHGAMGGRLVAKFDVAGLDLMWLTAVLLGFMLCTAAPIIVYRVRALRAAIILRCLAPVLLIFPLTTLAPAAWRYPLPATGMYLLAVTHILIAAALMIVPLPPESPAFPIQVKSDRPA